MFSIGEFARLGGVSVRTLRHYDEIGLLRPAQVDPVTGYRGYLASQLEAAVTVRSGPAASIFPVVYHDLIRWIDERGYRAAGGPGREVWVHEVDDVADVAQQVFEIQLPFTRPGTPAAELAMRPAEELRAERRLIAAWRRAAELRGATEPADWRLSEHSGLVIVVVLGGVRPISLVTHRPCAGTDNGLMIEVDPGHFEEMVITALDGLPEEFGRLMQNVAVIVEHDPGPPGLLGLYQGIPLTSRTSDYAGVLPDRITIYRREICAICRTEHAVADQVRRTVVHEIAHHFGIDDDRLTELGW